MFGKTVYASVETKYIYTYGYIHLGKLPSFTNLNSSAIQGNNFPFYARSSSNLPRYLQGQKP